MSASESSLPPLWNAQNEPLCGRRLKACRACKYKFKAQNAPDSDYELLNCPKCGASRRCEQVVEQSGCACKLHGGESLKGLASPRFTHGVTSKYFNPLVQTDFIEAYQNPDILSLKAGIAGADAMIAEIQREMEEGGSAEGWKYLKSLWRDLRQAQAKADRQKIAALLDRIDTLVEDGTRRSYARDELRIQTELRRKLTESEWKMKEHLGYLMPIEQLHVFTFGLAQVLANEYKAHLPPENAIEAIRITQKVLARLGAAEDQNGEDPDSPLRSLSSNGSLYAGELVERPTSSRLRSAERKSGPASTDAFDGEDDERGDGNAPAHARKALSRSAASGATGPGVAKGSQRRSRSTD